MNDIITNRYSVQHQSPTPGQRIRIYDIDVHSDYEGHEAVASTGSVDATMWYATVPSISNPERTIDVRFASYEEIPADGPLPRPDGLNADDSNAYSYALGSDGTVTPANATYADLYAIITALSNDLALEKSIRKRDSERLMQQQSSYRQDMSHIESTMREVKDEQGWCDDGTNEVIRRINEGLKGGWEFDEYRKLVMSRVSISATVDATVEVWHYEDDDADDPDNWRDEDGDEIDADETMTEALRSEYQRNGFDTVETA